MVNIFQNIPGTITTTTSGDIFTTPTTAAAGGINILSGIYDSSVGIFPMYPYCVDEYGNQLTDIDEMYKYVAKLYFDKQMKEIIDDSAT